MSETQTLSLPRDLRQRIVADALASPETEICGLLAGRGLSCTAAYPVKNVSPTPEIAFFMDPQGQINALQAMREDGEEMLAIYHSHPRSEAKPSARDIAGAAYPSVAYLIISLLNRDDPEIGAFAFDGKAFSAMELACPSVAG